jgi:formylglycine-generating enzyme required for sulfatase activity
MDEETKTVPEGFVYISGGTFTMGSPEGEPSRNDNEGQHQVRVSDFYMARYEVTQAEYDAVLGSNISNFQGASLPVENVSWFDAVEYCNARSLMEGLVPAYTISGTGDGRTVTWNHDAQAGTAGFRLPTEAEWEYACRAGTAGPFNTGGNITTDQANYNGDGPYHGNAQGIFRERTTDVGSFPPNPWGLYDMHGNVWEWCWDWFGDYSMEDQTDPVGPSSGANRVLRGGSWHYVARSLRSANRLGDSPTSRYGIVGFRLAWGASAAPHHPPRQGQPCTP